MRQSGQPRVWHLWLILALTAPLVYLMRGINRGQFSFTSTQDFFVLNGILVLLLVDAVLGALAIQAGRRAAWWPTLISLAGLGLWGYAVFTGWRGTVWSPF